MVFTLQMNLKRKNVKKEKRNKKTNLRRIQELSAKTKTKLDMFHQEKSEERKSRNKKKLRRKLIRKSKTLNQRKWK